jgi:RNase P/RNase MRP subunit p30
MKRIYSDLHLRLDFSDFGQVSCMIRKASRLGYNMVAAPLPQHAETQIQELRKLCEEAKLEFASRLDLRPRTPKELLNLLRKFRRSYEVIAVICESKNVARQAAKDRRVDLLNFARPDPRRGFFDAAEAELASNSLAALEIDIQPVLSLEGRARIRLLSKLQKEVFNAVESHVPIVISSGVSDELLLRKPQELVALASLFNLDEDCAIDAVSKNPISIVRRNREKLTSRFVAPGIYIVRRGKDC